MKAITICQPYAHLIMLPETDPRHKRVENRTWPTNYRGPLAIHAGKSRAWLDPGESETGEGRHNNYGILVSRMVFGCILGTCELLDCIRYDDLGLGNRTSAQLHAKYPWLADHQHASGPWCFVLGRVKRLEKPVPFRGAQGFYEIPDSILGGS